MLAWKPIAAAALAVLGGTRVWAAELCVTCHPNIKTEYADSVHAKEFSCTACHGGDPAVPTVKAHDVAKGYRGKVSRGEIPGICASCHADPNRMRPFSLPTDQYAQYQTSGHGQRLARGDLRVAVCTDCHGTHGIRSRQEPTSPTWRRNIAATCGRCHSDQTLMAEYGLSADQVAKFESSVHGEALLIDEHPSAPTCATCHGPHGAAAQHGGSIRTVCGHCHVRTREYFKDGAHGGATLEGKMAECTSCHGVHDTPRPDHTLFDSACLRCHAPDSPATALAQKLKTLLSQAQDAIETTDAEITEVIKLAPTTARHRPRLRQGWAHYMEALPVQHSLALDRVSDLTRSGRSIAEEVAAAVHGVRQELQLRYLYLAVVWVVILFAVAVTYLYRRERRAARQPDGAATGRR